MRSPGLVIAGAMLVFLSGCSSTPTASESNGGTATLLGVLSVPAFASERFPNGTAIVDGTCAADAGFEDFHEGAQITLLNPDGAIVALGELEVGTSAGDSGTCVFRFAISEVPRGNDFYSVDVGNDFRGLYTVPEDELGVYLRLSID